MVQKVELLCQVLLSAEGFVIAFKQIPLEMYVHQPFISQLSVKSRETCDL